jgi:ADP-ribose pyrophosphatase YjhB (NUDIX family)
MLYGLLKILVSLCFNLLNTLLGGKLPPFATVAVIVEQDNQYLVIELPRGQLSFPGGFMNWHETPAQAAKREGKEETGLDLSISHLINTYITTSTNLFSMSNVCLVYRGEVIGGTLHKSVEGTPRWLTEDELRTRVNTRTQGIFEDYLRFRQLHQDVTTSPASSTTPPSPGVAGIVP